MTLRIGLIGAGANTKLKHIPGFQKIDEVDLVTVCNRSRESAQKVADELGIPDISTDWREVVHRDDPQSRVRKDRNHLPKEIAPRGFSVDHQNGFSIPRTFVQVVDAHPVDLDVVGAEGEVLELGKTIIGCPQDPGPDLLGMGHGDAEEEKGQDQERCGHFAGSLGWVASSRVRDSAASRWTWAARYFGSASMVIMAAAEG